MPQLSAVVGVRPVTTRAHVPRLVAVVTFAGQLIVGSWSSNVDEVFPVMNPFCESKPFKLTYHSRLLAMV